MEKINILTIGGCAIDDILKCERSHVDLYNIDLYLGSISRQHEPGKVAARLKEEMEGILKNVKETKYYTPVLRQILYVIKEYVTPTSLIERLETDTVVIVDPAYEIKPFYFDGNEMFDIHLDYHTLIKQHMPDWFNQLILKHTMFYDNGSKEIALHQYHTIVKFLKYLDKKNVPVIVVDNLFTKKIFDPATNSVVDAVPLFNSRIPFGDTEDVLAKYNLIVRFYRNWRESKPDRFKLFSPNIDMIYADSNHHRGYHPTHLHHTCRKMLNNELKALIVEAVRDHKQKIILPSITKF